MKPKLVRREWHKISIDVGGASYEGQYALEEGYILVSSADGQDRVRLVLNDPKSFAQIILGELFAKRRQV